MLVVYLSRVCISFSILLNTLLGGKNNQTVSAGQWARKREGKFNLVLLLDTIFFTESDHCREAWIKWQIINTAINYYYGISDSYYSGKQKVKK